MATTRYIGCDDPTHKIGVPSLFYALHGIATGQKYGLCNKCGRPMDLYYEFKWQLEAGDAPSKVVGAFLPDTIESWRTEEGKCEVEFYPFLVVLDKLSPPQHRVIWLPYWHKKTCQDGRISIPYGQFAPSMEDHLFNSLISKARAAGLIV
jgi:hypothetical protein